MGTAFFSYGNLKFKTAEPIGLLSSLEELWWVLKV